LGEGDVKHQLLLGTLALILALGLVAYGTSPTAAYTFGLTPTPIPAGGEVAWTPITKGLDGAIFVFVPAGCFMMGSDDANAYDDEQPVHEVCLSAYWIGQTEVTNAQYKACVDADVCAPPAETDVRGTRCPDWEDASLADHPVVCVDWDQADAYARWVGGDLPTEAQWEYAARGPAGNTYPWGNDFEGARLNFVTRTASMAGATRPGMMVTRARRQWEITRPASLGWGRWI
jgi:iron(II)-dependent oxidoreductase